MATTVFTDATTTAPGTLVVAAWLNDVNSAVYSILGDGTVPPATKAAARTNLGLGTMATQNATAVAITGGAISGITDLAIADGGTGASTAAQALINLGATGRLLNVVRLTGASTYTPTAGTTRIFVELLGGGGAGGGSSATAAGQLSAGGGGASGSHALHYATSGFSGQAYSVGAGGAAVNGASGGAGGATTFLGVTVPGGLGGALGAATPNSSFTSGGASGAVATGANILNGSGTGGSYGLVFAGAAAFLSGAGAASPYGAGGAPVSGNVSGNSATGFSSGGSGGTSLASSPIEPGGNGAAGTIVIYEYA